jgi:hypothetical protein
MAFANGAWKDEFGAFGMADLAPKSRCSKKWGYLQSLSTVGTLFQKISNAAICLDKQ